VHLLVGKVTFLSFVFPPLPSDYFEVSLKKIAGFFHCRLIWNRSAKSIFPFLFRSPFVEESIRPEIKKIKSLSSTLPSPVKSSGRGVEVGRTAVPVAVGVDVVVSVGVTVSVGVDVAVWVAVGV